MKTFVISYKEGETVRFQYETTWKGKDFNDALLTFWNSYNEFDRQKVSDVKIYELVEIICDTTFEGVTQ